PPPLVLISTLFTYTTLFRSDESFIHIYERALTKIATFFKPDVIVSQNGADAHCYDPLTHLCSTMKTFEYIPLLAHELAHEYCGRSEEHTSELQSRFDLVCRL